MSVQIEAEEKDFLILRISGLVTQEDKKQWEEAVVKAIKRYGKAKALVILEGFQGWEKTDAWGDLSFLKEYDKKIEKIAFAGNPKWRDEIFAFTGKSLRSAKIEFFNTSQESEARTWLG